MGLYEIQLSIWWCSILWSAGKKNRQILASLTATQITKKKTEDFSLRYVFLHHITFAFESYWVHVTLSVLQRNVAVIV